MGMLYVKPVKRERTSIVTFQIHITKLVCMTKMLCI